MSSIPKRILDLAAARRVELPEDGAARLAAYAEAVVEVGATVNITAARTIDAVLDVLVGPSLVIALAWTRPDPPACVVDIGSGNGFPGVVAGVLWPGSDLVLLERRGRKASAMSQCLARSGIRARVLAIDAREVRREAPDLLGTVGLVTARGVGPLDVVNRLARPLLEPGGAVVHWKAFELDPEERRTADESLRELAMVCLDDVEFEPGPPGPGRLVRYVQNG